MEKMKKFFAVLKSVLFWFMLLTYPIFLMYLSFVLAMSFFMASTAVSYPN